jgi:hypothetical protein
MTMKMFKFLLDKDKTEKDDDSTDKNEAVKRSYHGLILDDRSIGFEGREEATIPRIMVLRSQRERIGIPAPESGITKGIKMKGTEEGLHIPVSFLFEFVDKGISSLVRLPSRVSMND